MTLTLNEARAHLDRIFDGYRQVAGAPSASILPSAITKGKTYEAWVLSRVLERLRHREGYSVTLVDSTLVKLKSSPGPINRNYAHFVLTRSDRTIEVWTDVEFVGLSAEFLGASPARCHYHELDIVVVPEGVNGRPASSEVLLGVECKNTDYSKDMLRSLLGVRRELSLLRQPHATAFDRWPRSTVPADPPSCLMAYGTDRRIRDYEPPGKAFGIDFVHEPLS